MSDELADLLTVDEAIRVIDSTPVTPRVKSIKLADAQGYRLAADITSDRDYPPFDKSLMDGYAVRAADVANAPVELDVIETITAGQRPISQIRSGQAAAIMTGAPIPDGADAIVPVEETSQSGSRVRILKSAKPRQFITARGADCPAGRVVLARGTKLEAAQLAVAASVGAAQVDVFDRPRVAVLATGDEIVPIDSPPGPAQIRNSNNIMLAALLRRLGCDVTDLGTARDEFDLIKNEISKGLQFDALFVSGGMSMGQLDHVPKVLIELGVSLKITKLRIKPGKPFVFGVCARRPLAVSRSESGATAKPQAAAEAISGSFVFGLPGNPLSGFACTLRLCSRLLARLGGGSPAENWIAAKLTSPLPKNGNREFYQPAILDCGNLTTLEWKGSADVYTLAKANALLRRAENEEPLAAGAEVRVLEIPS